MKSSKKLILIFLILPAVSLGMASAQTSGGNGGSFNIPGGLVPDNNTTGPVANVGAEYKFDDGFYQKIQDLILEEPQAGDYGVYDGERYYNVIMVVSRDDGDGRSPDETARENKEDRGEYLRVGLYDGSRWTTIRDWTHGSGNDDTWHHESYDLASYLDSSAFKLRLVTR